MFVIININSSSRFALLFELLLFLYFYFIFNSHHSLALTTQKNLKVTGAVQRTCVVMHLNQSEHFGVGPTVGLLQRSHELEPERTGGQREM